MSITATIAAATTALVVAFTGSTGPAASDEAPDPGAKVERIAPLGPTTLAWKLWSIRDGGVFAVSTKGSDTPRRGRTVFVRSVRVAHNDFGGVLNGDPAVRVLRVCVFNPRVYRAVLCKHRKKALYGDDDRVQYRIRRHVGNDSEVRVLVRLNVQWGRNHTRQVRLPLGRR